MPTDQRSIMAVLAHPDDESFGVAGAFRRYADLGYSVSLICGTRGEVGEISDPSFATPESLGEVREGELRTASDFMGITDLKFLDYRDGSLNKADTSEATGKIVRQIRRLRPQVIVTFDANGGYGHLDHIAIHYLTVAAFTLAAQPSAYPEQILEGLEPYAPSRLYAVAMLDSSMKKMLGEMQAQGINFLPGGDAATIPLEEMGTPDERVAIEMILTDSEYEAKMNAMAAHRTQMPASSPLNSLSDEARRQWLGTERFALLRSHGPLASDLFDGIA